MWWCLDHRYTHAVTGQAANSEPSSQPLSIVVFGQSNATGEHLADPQDAWPRLVAAELGERLGRAVKVEIRPIYVHSPGAERYLERELERWKPDVVLFGASSFAFAQRMVGLSIRRRWGDRPADLYQKLERRVDSRTRHSQAGSRANRLARKALVKVLGAVPAASYTTVLEGTETVLRRLAREEDVSVAIFQMNTIVSGRERSDDRVVLEQFDRDVRALSERYHFPLIDSRPAIAGAPDQASMLFADRLHYTPRAHRIVADVVLEAFEDGTIEAGGT